jgi:hypothetical protein
MVKKRAKKRSVRKKTSVSKSNSVIASRRKIRVVLINLAVFLLLTLISWFLLGAIGTNSSMMSLFFLLTWIFGFVSVAFLIVLLVLLLMRTMKK